MSQVDQLEVVFLVLCYKLQVKTEMSSHRKVKSARINLNYSCRVNVGIKVKGRKIQCESTPIARGARIIFFPRATYSINLPIICLEITEK